MCLMINLCQINAQLVLQCKKIANLDTDSSRASGGQEEISPTTPVVVSMKVYDTFSVTLATCNSTLATSSRLSEFWSAVSVASVITLPSKLMTSSAFSAVMSCIE